jgi:elongation factor G
MAVEVVTPDEFLGDGHRRPVLARGRVEAQEPRGNAIAVVGQRPAVVDVRVRDRPASNTQGRANYSMQFDRYEEVPNNVAEEIVEHRTGDPVGAGT